MIIADGIALLTSLNKLLQAVLRGHPQQARLTRQMIEGAPSTYRTAPVMIAALRLANAGLIQHADKFESR
jgi:hypothetical protein